MGKIDKLNISDIIEVTNVYFNDTNILRIWKEDTPFEIIDRGTSTLKRIIQTNELTDFILEYGMYIDKVKFLVCLIDSCEERLKEYIDEKERGYIIKGIRNARELLSDVDETLAFYVYNEKTSLIDGVKVFNTKEMSKGMSRRDRNDNVQRFLEIDKVCDFGNITQAILRFDIENVIVGNPGVAQALKYKIEFNSFAKLLDKTDEREKLRQVDILQLAEEKPHSVFVDEIISTLKANIEEVDLDKLLLSAARNYINMLENAPLKEKENEMIKNRLQVIRTHIRRLGTKVPTYEEGIVYSIKTLEQDLTRFIPSTKGCRYMSTKDCEGIKSALIEGEILLNELTVSIYEALNLKVAEISKILRRNPENYIFFLRQGKVIDSKDLTLRNIIASKKCSRDLLELLCENTDITAEEISHLFDIGILSIGDLKAVRDKVGTIITDEQLFSRYKQYKSDISKHEEAEETKMQLERYALAYRSTELAGKTTEETEERGEEFVTNVGEEIEPIDLVTLYGLDIIPLKVAVDWGGEDIIEKLLRKETLKPSDAKYLRTQGLLDEKVIERLFRNSVNMSYSYQVSLVCAIFDGETVEEENIRQRLAQYYNIENAISNSQKKNSSGKRKKLRASTNMEEPETRIKMRDPGAKYNALTDLDEDTRIEEGIVDGHIIFHYPNIEDGVVLIEKLHKIKLNSETGLIEIKADNESATYVMSEEEFIKMKPQLIKDGKVDRTELTQRWWVTRDPKHWLPHIGKSGWEEALTYRFDLNEENQRLSPERLAKIRERFEKTIRSRNMER